MFLFGNPVIPHLKSKPFIYLGLHVGGWVPCIRVEVGGQLVGVCFHSSLWVLSTNIRSLDLEASATTCRASSLASLFTFNASLLIHYYHHCCYWHTENWTQCLRYARQGLYQWAARQTEEEAFSFCIPSWNHFCSFWVVAATEGVWRVILFPEPISAWPRGSAWHLGGQTLH